MLGAKQNRVFDASVLVAAGVRLKLPVSCLEQGRWDPRGEHEHFDVALQASDPSMRRLKRARANTRAAAGMPARPDQGEVWGEVSARLVDHDVASPSAALDDVYKARRQGLDEIADALLPVDGQVGAIAFVGPRLVALDLVGRPDVFISLLPRLAQGYALEALDGEKAEPERDSAQAFLAAAMTSVRRPLPTPGLGRAFALSGPSLTGSALEHEGELVQLSAFPPDSQESEAHGQATIARPSRRRRRVA